MQSLATLFEEIDNNRQAQARQRTAESKKKPFTKFRLKTPETNSTP